MSIRRIAKRILPSRVWTVLRMLRVETEQRLFRRRVVQHTYSGIPLSVLIADPLGSGWYDVDWGPQRELELLRRHRLTTGATVFDLGAHQAVVALMLAAIVGKSGRVIALEADPYNAEVARQNAALNPAHAVEVVHAAISDTRGELVFTRNGHVDQGSEGGVRVPCVTIDDLSESHGTPDVLFIDVEGFETHALRGATRTLATRPDCYVEVHVGVGLEQFGSSAAEVLRFFPEGAYERWVAPADSEEPFVPYDAALPLIRSRFMLVAIAKRG